MNLKPISLKQANAFVTAHHRHSKATVGHKFSIGLVVEEELVGVCIVGRPVARSLDDGYTAEVLRCCTNGVKNGCSMLYGAAWRAAKAMGYRKLVTYTLQKEPGASLRASNWTCEAELNGSSSGWDCKSRPRENINLRREKFRWEITV